MHRVQAGLALIPVALTILWLPLAGGGTDSRPLRLVEILTFIAVAVLVLLRATLIVREDRKLILALGIVL
ncbi:MAG TPA: hypothetical protein VNA87_05140, partial [Actinomycetota bacterium]|nr:hypothetical protein [Actinomycetota bacterium]